MNHGSVSVLVAEAKYLLLSVRGSALIRVIANHNCIEMCSHGPKTCFFPPPKALSSQHINVPGPLTKALRFI